MLETQSLPIPRNSKDVIHYRFNQKFDIKPDEKQFKLLKSMVKRGSNDQMKFLVISEPIEGNDDDNECEEVG